MAISLSMDRLGIPQKLPFSSKRLRARIILSYIFDYLIIVGLTAGFFFFDAIEPFHQHFALQNFDLQYPHALHERVSTPLLLGVSVAFPAVVVILHTLVIDAFSHHKVRTQNGGRTSSGRYGWKDRLWQLNCGILGLLLSSSAAFCITTILKNAVGRPRPDLIDRCQPRLGSVDPPVFGLSTSAICTQTDHAILKDGFRSWPSGHSSSSFAGLFYLSLYLSAKLHIMDMRGEVWKTVIVLIPTLAATLVAISRIMDSRHHPFDVISGSLLGILVAWGSYRQYFPPVSKTWNRGRAYPITSWAREPPSPAEKSFDTAREPLRVAVNGQEETAVAGVENNVFREQVDRTRRQRDQAYGSGGGGAGEWSGSENDADDYELRPRYPAHRPTGSVGDEIGYEPTTLPAASLSHGPQWREV